MKNEQAESAKSMAEAMGWVSKITTACILMILPGLAGMWTDNQLHSSPIFGLLGLVLGMWGGLYLLIKATK